MCLLDLFHDILKTRQLESSWRHRMYVMLPKSGHLSETNNGRPIAILKIVYIFFIAIASTASSPIGLPTVCGPT